jgi:dTDP-4-dehydrorhamnose 3,5-epimerase
MEIKQFEIAGLKLVELKTYPDLRGFFTERFKTSSFSNAGLPYQFVQDNFSRSLPKVLRGLHYQYEKPQGKLVTCLSGKIFDVAVDLRAQSPTFGRHQSVVLDGDKPCWFWVPAGFAHGFCVIGEKPADVYYKTDQEYNPSGEEGLAWNDKVLNIDWPYTDPILNSKDQKLMSFEDYQKSPRFG